MSLPTTVKSPPLSEYDYPNSHSGHLSPAQATALTQFKSFCSDKGYYQPARESSGASSHDDATLLCFLRARRFDVASAVEQFAADCEWRKDNSIDDMYETMDPLNFRETRCLYPQWTGRRDRRGLPVFLYEIKHLTPAVMAAFDKSSKEKFLPPQSDGKTPARLLRMSAIYEYSKRFTFPLCSALQDRVYPETPITQTVNIVDISGVSFKQFWDLRSHMTDASKIATAHYPETLDRIFILGAPSFFPTIWGWIKKLFDVNTTSKIMILSAAEVPTTLASFIDPQNIPSKYGGQLAFQHGDESRLDPALARLDMTWHTGRSDFPTGPMYWVDEGDRMEAYVNASAADGSSSNSREKICTWHKSAATTH